jgi:hypothetical protein
MQITDFTFNKATFTTYGADNLWRLDNDTHVRINQPAGKGWRFTIKEGFITNFRSGSDLMNPIIPRMGNEARSLCYVIHDACYTWLGAKADYHCMDKNTADALLKAMLTFCDDCDRVQIDELKQLALVYEFCSTKESKAEIKRLEKQILGSFKIWCISKALALFGGPAYREKNPPPYDKNSDKVLMEVLE